MTGPRRKRSTKVEGEKERLRGTARAVEQRFQDLVQDLDAIVWEADAATWRFSFVSQRAEAILGYPVEQWLTEPDFWARHIHPEDREWAVRFCQTATSEGKDHQFEYRALAADGRVVWLRDMVRVVKGGDGHARQLRGVMVDITPLKETEEALAERTKRLEAVRAVTEEITRELDLTTLLGLITRRAAELVGAVSGGVYLWDDAAQVLVPRAWYGLGKWMGKVHLHLGEGISGTVAQRREGLIVNDYRSSPYTLPLFLERTGITANVSEPLLYGDRLLGVITINNEGTGRPFTKQDREILALFANQAAIAIENARLLDARDEAKRVLEQLYTVGVSLHASRELEDRLGNFLHGVRGVVGFDRINVFLLNPDQSVLDLVVSAAGDILTTLLSIPLDSAGPFAEAIHTKRRLLIERKEDLQAFPPFDPGLSRLPLFRSTRFVVIPLVAGDQVVGVVGADNKVSRRSISPASVEQLQLFCQELAVAIENARLHEGTVRHAHHLATLNTLARTLTTTLDPQAVGREILAAVQTLIPGAASRLWERLADEEVYRLVASIGLRDPEGGLTLTLRPGEGLTGIAALTRQPVMSRDVTQDPRFVNKAWAAAEGLVSGIIVPLLYGERVTGALAIFTRTTRDFTDEEVDLLRSFAAQAAIALENARLVKNLQQALDDLKGAQDQLVRGTTLRALGEMASGMAHHLNNLLAVVLGRIELLLQKVQEPEIRRSLEIVGQATREGAEVVRRVQGFSRMKPISDVVPVDLNQLVSEVLELLRPLWYDRAQARGIQIQASLEPGLIPAVAGEPASLREVMVNLLLNAVEALPVGGAITVKTWVEDQGVYCSVSDTGVGMVEEVQRRVLEPFFTTKGPKSPGLGLSLSYAIIQRHGGDLAIESAEGRGTTVTIRLPVAREAAVGKPRGVTLPAPTLTILVIDDEAEVLNTLAEMLTSQGHKVLPASGGLEGLARLEAGEPVDLVLTDLGMPGMTGWEVARAVKGRWPHLPVGLVTGWGEAPEAFPEERRRVDFVLAKPVTLEALREATARIHPKSPAP